MNIINLRVKWFYSLDAHRVWQCLPGLGLVIPREPHFAERNVEATGFLRAPERLFLLRNFWALGRHRLLQIPISQFAEHFRRPPGRLLSKIYFKQHTVVEGLSFFCVGDTERVYTCSQGDRGDRALACPQAQGTAPRPPARAQQGSPHGGVQPGR